MSIALVWKFFITNSINNLFLNHNLICQPAFQFNRRPFNSSIIMHTPLTKHKKNCLGFLLQQNQTLLTTSQQETNFAFQAKSTP